MIGLPFCYIPVHEAQRELSRAGCVRYFDSTLTAIRFGTAIDIYRSSHLPWIIYV